MKKLFLLAFLLISLSLKAQRLKTWSFEFSPTIVQIGANNRYVEIDQKYDGVVVDYAHSSDLEFGLNYHSRHQTRKIGYGFGVLGRFGERKGTFYVLEYPIYHNPEDFYLPEDTDNANVLYHFSEKMKTVLFNLRPMVSYQVNSKTRLEFLANFYKTNYRGKSHIYGKTQYLTFIKSTTFEQDTSYSTTYQYSNSFRSKYGVYNWSFVPELRVHHDFKPWFSAYVGLKVKPWSNGEHFAFESFGFYGPQETPDYDNQLHKSAFTNEDFAINFGVRLNLRYCKDQKYLVVGTKKTWAWTKRQWNKYF